ncbi:T9SS type A sorting domain-containing protein [bacterium]|nr:T9SS type A sorting domain-containing protein [bacterium]
MKTKYTDEDFHLFYQRFKKLPQYFELNQVHQLINSPNAKATHWAKFNPLKLLIMTSTLIIGVTSFLLWMNPKPVDVAQNPNQQDKTIHTKQNQEIKNIKQAIEHEFVEKNRIDATKIASPVKSKLPVSIQNKNASQQETIPINDCIQDMDTIQERDIIDQEPGCNWPSDTLIDKNSLYVYLSNDELEKVGIRVVNPSGSKYYIHSFSNSNYHGVNTDSVSSKITTRFSLRAISDTLCTTHRVGHYFYDEVDGLLPIRPTDFDNKNLIFWFEPNFCWGDDLHGDSIFKVLPERYSHLKETFDNLSCLKKKFPEKSFVNHINESQNIILDQINFLHLNKKELEHIGINLKNQKVEMIDITDDFSYRMDSNNCRVSSTWVPGDKIHPKIYPKLFPSLITDIKGLELNRFGEYISDTYARNDENNYDLLIPVFLPISEYVNNRDYDVILWYYPTDEFLSALPKRIRSDLKSELKSIKNPESKKSNSCNYFEVCKSTLKLDNFKIYPNPAKDFATIEFDTNEELEGSVSIVNLCGASVRALIPKSLFLAGHNTYQMEIAGITPGMYLISINTNKGFKTQRLIISK